MNKTRTILGREPVLWQALILALINLAVVFNWVSWTPTELGVINAVVAAVLGFVVRQVVTPLIDPKKKIDGVEVSLVPETTTPTPND